LKNDVQNRVGNVVKDLKANLTSRHFGFSAGKISNRTEADEFEEE